MARRIDAGLARKTVALLRAQGLPAEAVLARAGLDTATLRRKGARIPFAAHVALLEYAAAAARDPCFGLHLGAALHPRDLGLVGYLGANAATLGDVLYVAGKYLPLLTEGTRVEIDRLTRASNRGCSICLPGAADCHSGSSCRVQHRGGN